MKKYIYFASFAAGMQFIVKDILEKRMTDLKIYQLFDGAVLFETNKTYDKFDIYCFNNIFSVITFMKKKTPKDINSFIQQIIRLKLQNDVISNNIKKHHTFRVVVSSENQLFSIDNALRVKLENLISSQSKLKLNRSNSDIEFWILYRTEGFCYFMKRLSKHTAYEKILNKGELHPEITFFMNWLAESDKNDIVLDPFCGNGAIPLRRALNFPAKQIYAFDVDNAMINIVHKKIKQNNSLVNIKNLFIKQVDIKNLDKEFQHESIDKIITDPPWGHYNNDNKIKIEEFYNLSLSKMANVLKTNGLIVLLVSRQIDIESLIKPFPNLLLLQNFNVLISGKKANLVKIKKIKTAD